MRSRQSKKKDKQCNGEMLKNKKTINDQENITQKTKDYTMHTALKLGMILLL